ncbi:uncharacterized protein F5147DRAFT_763488 [Suillus discolor]|uniref:Uncharacterized protein n=1 Tax=Suillus discolor TaxID=1912936 RepID=A0A9P7EZI7_9AGAM|nr:uncharacterized protein F5147DRAFT_763488 [Suillus discolor]KAG2096697.1 hypothetical protein F5147DRAFT_763488 [Suillus discolor]
MNPTVFRSSGQVTDVVILSRHYFMPSSVEYKIDSTNNQFANDLSTSTTMICISHSTSQLYIYKVNGRNEMVNDKREKEGKRQWRDKTWGREELGDIRKLENCWENGRMSKQGEWGVDGRQEMGDGRREDVGDNWEMGRCRKKLGTIVILPDYKFGSAP